MSEKVPVVGEIVYTIYGYDATFYEFYEVVEVSESGWVTYQELGKKREFGESPYPSVVAVFPTEEKVGKPFKRKIKKSDYGWWSKGKESYQVVTGQFTGKPEFESAPGTY